VPFMAGRVGSSVQPTAGQWRGQAGSAEFAGFELRGLQTGNRRKAAEFLRIETLRYLAHPKWKDFTCPDFQAEYECSSVAYR